MNEVLNVFLAIYAGLFPIVDPVGNIPIFLGLTRHDGNAERSRLARVVAINSFFLLFGSLVVGSYVLEFFGVTLPVVRIAGGLVVTAFGWKLLQSGDAEDGPDDLNEDHQRLNTSDCFYPLTMPLTVGPGSISVAITLGSQRPKETADLIHIITIGAAATGGHRGDNLHLLSLWSQNNCGTWTSRNKCNDALVSIYSLMHRHPNSLGRLDGIKQDHALSRHNCRLD